MQGDPVIFSRIPLILLVLVGLTRIVLIGEETRRASNPQYGSTTATIQWLPT
jgi:hypothetical protein